MDYYPQLASTGKLTDLDNSNLRFEPKLDGIRCLAYITNEVRLYSRVGKEVTASFPDVVEQLSELTQDCNAIYRLVLDGEIVAGVEIRDDVLAVAMIKANFQDLQTRLQRKVNVTEAAALIPAKFYAFDVLEMAGLPILDCSYAMRRNFLYRLKMDTNDLEIVPSFTAPHARRTFNWAIEQGCEGFVAKHTASTYEPGSRSKDWLKIKPIQTIDCYCIGATYGYGRRDNYFGSMVLVDSQHKFIGLVGTGFDDESLKCLTEVFIEEDRAQYKNPENIAFKILPLPVYRELLYTFNPMSVRVNYQERTKAGMLRFPSFVEVIENK